MNIEQARFNMIEQQIRPWDVLDPAVLAVLARVHREDFVPAGHEALAFVDAPIPLTDAGLSGEVMLEPRIEARLLQELQLQPSDRVLEIGTGSGFMALLLSQLAATVTTIDIDARLADQARARLAKAGAQGVQVIHGDAAKQLPEGPFDAIVLSGSVSEVPMSVLSLLAPGGRLLAIVGEDPIMRARLYRRDRQGGLAHEDLFDTVAPRLKGFPEASRFHF
jgi:protein-L-isoaspartate(D-aspartate) O-methyltransferase